MGTISSWYKVYADPNRNYADVHGLGYFIIGRFDDHPKFPGLRSHTAYIVRERGDFIETKQSTFTLKGGWHESQEFFLRWRELSVGPVRSLSQYRRRPRGSQSPDQYALHLLRPSAFFVPVLRRSS